MRRGGRRRQHHRVAERRRDGMLSALLGGHQWHVADRTERILHSRGTARLMAQLGLMIMRRKRRLMLVLSVVRRPEERMLRPGPVREVRHERRRRRPAEQAVRCSSGSGQSRRRVPSKLLLRRAVRPRWR